MKTRGQHTLTEITTQPEAWAEALQAFTSTQSALKQAWANLNPKRILFTGCGSTYYLAKIAARLLQGLTGLPAHGCPASEIVLFPAEVLLDPKQTLLVTISRSGTTTETLSAMAKFRQLGGPAIWGITCYPGSPLAQEADLVLPAEAGQEQSLAQTRSFASMLILAQALAAAIAGEDIAPLNLLPALGQSLISQSSSLAERLGARTDDLTQFFFLGSGPQYGLACEAMLKMKEMSLSHSEAFHFLEFRHGPKSMVDEQALVLGLLSPAAFAHEWQVLDEMAALGGQILALTPFAEKTDAHWTINLAPHLPTWARPALYLPFLQLMAYYRAINKGLDPDLPRHLDAVVYLDATALAA
jgi:glucosamine--fructose-6-phosphate aminotransferase (isomerizing)